MTITAKDIYAALCDMNAGRITADECRAVMRASREQHGEAEHQRLKAIAVSNFDRNTA